MGLRQMGNRNFYTKLSKGTKRDGRKMALEIRKSIGRKTSFVCVEAEFKFAHFRGHEHSRSQVWSGKCFIRKGDFFKRPDL